LRILTSWAKFKKIMKEILQSFFKTTEERIKNPFIGAFMTSWILFNWKPILFIILSSKNIEDKIKYISVEYSNIKFLIYFPIFTAIFYVLILPYLSLVFDILLKYSLLKRNEIVITKQKQNIENQKQLAIEEIRLEEAKTDFRERNTHNKLVEDLQSQNKNFEIEMQREKERNYKMIDELKSQLNERDKVTDNELKMFERRYSDSRKEISDLNSNLYEKDQQIQELKMLLRERDMNENERFRTNVIMFDNDLRIIERFDGNNVIYYNTETNERYSEKEIKRLMDTHKYERQII
jgi:hypothetical protein